MNKIKRLLCQWESPELVAYKLIQEWGEAGFIWPKYGIIDLTIGMDYCVLNF